MLAGCGDNKTVPPNAQAPSGSSSSTPAINCVPNLDGRIDSTEMTPVLNVPVNFLVSPDGRDRPVNVAGGIDRDGRRFWDFSAPAPDDRAVSFTASALDGKWYKASFASATFASPLNASGSLEGVYSFTAEALSLHGIASKEESSPQGKTLLVYSRPVHIFEFPLTVDKKWTATAEVQDGTLNGLPYFGRDTYEIAVDGVGRLVLPDVEFSQAMRVRTKLTSSPSAGQVTVQRQVNFLFECFGEVTRAASRPNDNTDDFTVASEVRRLGI